MGVATVLFLSVGLAMDATAVAATRGFASASRSGHGELAAIALCFGGMQAGLSLAGALAEAQIGTAVASYDHWIAFALLAFIGGKMLYDVIRGGDEEEPLKQLSLPTLLLLGLATSIDALAAGFTLRALAVPIGLTVAAIGVVTAALSAVGYLIGRRLGGAFGKQLTAVGGVALIAIGIKVLFDHGVLTLSAL